MDQTLHNGPPAPSPVEPAPPACAAYDGATSCIGAARRFATAYLHRIHTEQRTPLTRRAVGTAQLVVSELVTNACRYAPGPLRLDLRHLRHSLEITVWDTAAALPTAHAPDPSRIGRHGLEIVLAVCAHYDVQPTSGGKRTTAVLALTDPPAGR
ncbi:ATP-binding protein [Streptomyces sp. NPDC005907]|uniref:ATP-binding protein n=1 Tax=Streptomyces sp. NPDC005907 TaxID=3154571 RepID=UPI0034075695